MVFPKNVSDVFKNMMIAGDTLINYNIRNFKRASEYKPLRHRGTDQRKLLDQFNKNFNLKESSDIISKLYDMAKRDPSKIELYREAIYEAIDTDPVAYIKNINKIIPSSVGLDTLYEFVYTNGISILSYQPIVESIESCIDKYNSLQKDASLYNEALEFMESFKNTYRHNFYMFENFRDSLQPNYIEAYYKNFPILREGKEVNFAKMIERFGESVIPDMLIYASMFGNPMNIMMPFKERYDRIDTTTKLWLEECEKDLFTEGIFDKIFRSNRSNGSPSAPQSTSPKPEVKLKIFILDDLKKEHRDFLIKLFKEFYLSIPRVINKDNAYEQLRKHIKGISNNIDEYLALDAISKFEFYFFGSFAQIGLIDYHMEINIFDGLDIDNDIPPRFMQTISNKICDELSEKHRARLEQYGLSIQKPFDDGNDEFALWLETINDTIYSGYKEKHGITTESTIREIFSRHTRAYQESVILGEEKEISFTESELESIQDLISFKENLITLVESEEERMQLQREVYTLYEAAEDLLDEDVADSVIPMLPGANQNVGTRSINEDWLNNTHNKKTGSMPDYLKNAHDLNWGEDDDAPPKKRPSASDDDKPDDDDDLPSDDKKEKDPLDKIEPFDYDSNKSDSSDDKKDDSAKSSSGHIQNYYYYTYNNSNNTHSTTNTNSYNRSQDDHSRNKRMKSHDYGGLKEEKQIWELDIPSINEEIYMENDQRSFPDFTMDKIPNKYLSAIFRIHKEFFKELKDIMRSEFQDLYKTCEKYITERINIKLKPSDFEASLAIAWMTDGNGQVVGKTPTLDIVGEYFQDFPSYEENYYELQYAVNIAAGTLISRMSPFMRKHGLRIIDRDEDYVFYLRCDESPYINEITNHRIPKESLSIHEHMMMENTLDNVKKILSTVSRHVSTVLPKNRMQAVQEYDSAIFQRKMIIPFRQYFGKKSARTKLNESVDSFTEARAVPREYNPGHVLGMSKYDYRNIAMKLSRQFGVNIIFMNSSSPINKATVATTGGAFVGCVDERKLLAMARGNKKMMQRLQNEVQQSAEENNEDIIDTLIKQTLGGSRDKGVKKYIFIDIDNMRKHFGSFRNPTALETILRHEIGHIFTLDKISDADFEKYACARPFIMIFNGIIQQLTNLPENKILAFSNLHIYHQLLVEKAANDYARINPAALTRILLGTDAPPPIPGINLNALRDLSVPRNVASIMLTCIASGMYSNENDEALVDNFLLKDSLKKILSPQLYEKLKNIIKENDPKKYAIVFEGSSKAKKNIIPEDKVPKQIIRKTIGEAKQKNKNESVMYEDVLDDQMPKSDNPIQDTMLDLDRKLSSVQQSIKSKAQGVQRTASAIAKPFKRTSQWIGSMIARWKDANENEIKAKMADPHERSGLLSAFKSAVKYGSLMKAGLLLNPIFMFLSISRKWSNRKNTFRIRNEMIGELKAELEIIEEKIRDAGHAGDRAAKYKLMRFHNELKKKLIRVGGTPEMKNMI